MIDIENFELHINNLCSRYRWL